MPLRARQQSKGLGLAPNEQEVVKTSLWQSASLKTSPPMTKSEWPPMYLVKLWQATSAPRRIGEVMQGEEKVLSTMTLMLGSTALTAFTHSSMSISLRVGLVGVSIQTILVSFLMAFTTVSGCVMSIKSAVIPWLSAKNFLMYLWVPPQTSSQTTMWAPGFKVCSRVAVAPHPLANVTAPTPYSRAVRQSSSAFLVGFPHREQSNSPKGSAMSFWAYVDER